MFRTRGDGKDPVNMLFITLTQQMATLAVHEAMGAKVDREATATLVLPQLWAMSMGPREFAAVYSFQ